MQIQVTEDAGLGRKARTVEVGPSPRYMFQWKYLAMVPTASPPLALNVGCASDPLEFGDLAWHFDLDDWSSLHKHFTQGDAHFLPFKDGQFVAVVLGDILEHAYNPFAMLYEACRVADRWVVATVFEEWRLPDKGQHVKAGQIASDKDSQALGYKDREDAQLHLNPQRKGVSDDEIPHLSHINQFTDWMLINLIRDVVHSLPEEEWFLREFHKTEEQRQDDHDWSNWLFALERKDQ